ncbi:hypothetical protein LguiA_012859 [Lonicera macranthoides]
MAQRLIRDAIISHFHISAFISSFHNLANMGIHSKNISSKNPCRYPSPDTPNRGCRQRWGWFLIAGTGMEISNHIFPKLKNYWSHRMVELPYTYASPFLQIASVS